MINKFCYKPLWECTEKLSKVAIGREKADLVIKNAKLVNVCTKEIIEDIDVAVSEGRVARIGSSEGVIGEKTVVIDALGKYLAPAFMDAHMHLESSMLTFTEYAKAVIPHGTSGVFYDPHEICNVLGKFGVKSLVDEAKIIPLKAMLTFPSCVPAVKDFEDNGATIFSKDIREVMRWDETVALGEMMNFPGVINSDKQVHKIIGETLKAGKTVQGHYSVPETGNGLNAYVSSGARNCHESVRAEDALAKMRLGMYAFIREGSAWRDLKEVIKAVTENKIDSRFLCLVTDDSHPNTLIKKGHLDFLIKRAVEEGLDFITAIQAVTINVATCYGLDGELGSIAPSKCADMVLIDNIENCHVTDVFIDGKHVAKGGKLLEKLKGYEFKKRALNTVKLPHKKPSDFDIAVNKSEVKITAIEVSGGKTVTKPFKTTIKAENGVINGDENQDVLKAFVLDRHHKNGKSAYGFIKGFGIKKGALAQTVAHDAHNMIVIGASSKDMSIAVNTLIDSGGGLVAVLDGKILAHVPLAIAGLISKKTLEETANDLFKLEKAWKEMGSTLPSPFMTMALLPLAVIPEIRLTNRGLIDCNKFEFISAIEE